MADQRDTMTEQQNLKAMFMALGVVADYGSDSIGVGPVLFSFKEGTFIHHEVEGPPHRPPLRMRRKNFPMAKPVEEVKETYLDREIKARLERGDSKEDIAAECGVTPEQLELFQS